MTTQLDFGNLKRLLKVGEGLPPLPPPAARAGKCDDTYVPVRSGIIIGTNDIREVVSRLQRLPWQQQVATARVRMTLTEKNRYKHLHSRPSDELTPEDLAALKNRNNAAWLRATRSTPLTPQEKEELAALERKAVALPPTAVPTPEVKLAQRFLARFYAESWKEFAAQLHAEYLRSVGLGYIVDGPTVVYGSGQRGRGNAPWDDDKYAGRGKTSGRSLAEQMREHTRERKRGAQPTDQDLKAQELKAPPSTRPLDADAPPLPRATSAAASAPKGMWGRPITSSLDGAVFSAPVSLSGNSRPRPREEQDAADNSYDYDEESSCDEEEEEEEDDAPYDDVAKSRWQRRA